MIVCAPPASANDGPRGKPNRWAVFGLWAAIVLPLGGWQVLTALEAGAVDSKGGAQLIDAYALQAALAGIEQNRAALPNLVVRVEQTFTASPDRAAEMFEVVFGTPGGAVISSITLFRDG